MKIYTDFGAIHYLMKSLTRSHKIPTEIERFLKNEYKNETLEHAYNKVFR